MIFIIPFQEKMISQYYKIKMLFFGNKDDKKKDPDVKKDSGADNKKTVEESGKKKAPLKEASPTNDSKKNVSKKSETEEKKDSQGKSMKELYGDNTKSNKLQGEKKETKPKQEKSSANGRAYRVLVKPLITEKASLLGGQNKYLFAVESGVNKIEIANAVEEVYGIRPISVNVVKMRGKIVQRGRFKGKRKDWKKAIITLKKGETIQIYEGI